MVHASKCLLERHPELSGTSKVTTMDVNEETFRIIYFSSLPFLDELTTDFNYTVLRRASAWYRRDSASRVPCRTEQ